MSTGRFEQAYYLLRNYYYNYDSKISKKCYLLSLKLLEHLIECPFIIQSNWNTILISYNNGSISLEVDINDKGYRLNGVNTEFDYTDKGIFLDENHLFEVINHVKIYFKGMPRKAVLFTGAFNPPHVGHYNMIECVKNNNFDYIIFATSNQKFLDKKQKEINDYYYTEQQRLDMLLEMTYKVPSALIFGIEHGYTYNVLCSVKEKYNIKDLYFSMGSDKLDEIDKWGYNDKLLSEFCFFVVLRGDILEEVKEKCKILKNEYIIVKNTKYQDVNATEIRKNIKENGEYLNLCPKVSDYLKKL